jgi:uncharacterized protein YbjQ (UPF0145 family)
MAYYPNQIVGLGNLGFTQNQELPAFTQGVYGAREVVIERITEQASRLQASGVVGVRVSHNIRKTSLGMGNSARDGLMVTFHAIGTAIREAEDATLYPPEMTIDLTT